MDNTDYSHKSKETMVLQNNNIAPLFIQNPVLANIFSFFSFSFFVSLLSLSLSLLFLAPLTFKLLSLSFIGLSLLGGVIVHRFDKRQTQREAYSSIQDLLISQD